MAEVNSSFIAGGGAASDQAACKGQAAQTFVPSGLADMLENDVNATAVGQALHFHRDFLLRVVNQLVGAEFTSLGELHRGAGRGDHTRTGRLGQLDSGGADAAARAENKDCFTGGEASPREKHVPGREKNQGKGVRFLEGGSFGHGDNIGSRSRNEFGAAAVEALAQQSVLRALVVVALETFPTFPAGDAGLEEDFIAGTSVGDGLAHSDDFSGDVAAGNVRERDSGKAAADPKVEMVESAGTNANEDGGRADHGVGDVGIFQNLGTAVFFKEDRLHRDLARTIEEAIIGVYACPEWRERALGRIVKTRGGLITAARSFAWPDAAAKLNLCTVDFRGRRLLGFCKRENERWRNRRMFCERCGRKFPPKRSTCERCGQLPARHWLQLQGLLTLSVVVAFNAVVALYLLPRHASGHDPRLLDRVWLWADYKIAFYGWIPAAAGLLAWDLLVWQVRPKVKGWVTRKVLTFTLLASVAPFLPSWVPAGQPSQNFIAAVGVHPGLPGALAWGAVVFVVILLCANRDTRDSLLGHGRALSLISLGLLTLVLVLTIAGWAIG